WESGLPGPTVRPLPRSFVAGAPSPFTSFRGTTVKHTLSVLVENKPGVLARISSLLARRGFNIHSLTVGPSHEAGLSRMTIVVDAPELEQVKKQLHKLVNVVKISELEDRYAIEREIMLVRVNAQPARRPELLSLASIFDATAVDVGPNSIAFQVVGAP